MTTLILSFVTIKNLLKNIINAKTTFAINNIRRYYSIWLPARVKGYEVYINSHFYFCLLFAGVDI